MKTSKSGLAVLNQEELTKLVIKIKESDTSKGILVLGEPGHGKTTVLNQHLNKFVTTNTLVEEFVKREFDGLHQALNLGVCEQNIVESGNEFFGNQVYPKGVFIDDIGTEMIASKFGNKVDPFEWAVQYIYNKKNIRLWGTSNLNLTELENRYGIRVVSRLKEMCHIVILEQEDYRTLTSLQEIETLLN